MISDKCSPTSYSFRVLQTIKQAQKSCQHYMVWTMEDNINTMELLLAAKIWLRASALSCVEWRHMSLNG